MSRRGWIGFAAAVLLGHGAVVFAWPFVKMQLVMRSMARDAGGTNRWLKPPPARPGTSGVRPSPEMAYAACVYDLSAGPVTLRAQPWPGYMSLSFYSPSGGNYAVLNNSADPAAGLAVTLTASDPARGGTGRSIRAPGRKGIVLLRRLAPGPRWPVAARLRDRDVCAAAS